MSQLSYLQLILVGAIARFAWDHNLPLMILFVAFAFVASVANAVLADEAKDRRR